MNFSKLNDKQIEAIKHKDGPCLVLAGAGSGKTSVLTNRVAYLIEEGIEPNNILAITFTNKAAKEMKERVIKLIGSIAYNIQISTFHSLGVKILKNNYHNLGYNKNFVIIDSDDSLSVIKKIMKEMNLDPKYYVPREIRSKISSAKNELLTPDMLSKIEYDRNIINIYIKYLQVLKINNSVDFDDLLILPIKLFKESPEILKQYQNIYRYILVDEYQDTNQAQYVFCKMLSDKYRNIFVVGDDSQSIYSFRGANYRNILNFENDYPDTHTIMLEQNYRSTRMILDAANSVIRNNRDRKDKNLWCNNEEGTKIKYTKTNDEKEESEYVVKEIKKLLDKGIEHEDICVLYRTNAQSRVVEEEMLKGGIAYRIVGSVYFYNRKEIKDLICYLRLIYNEKDDVSLLRVINEPKRGIGNKTISNLAEKASSNSKSIFEVIDSGKELEFKKLILELKELSNNLSLTELVDLVLEKSGMKAEFNNNTMDGEIRLENLEEFKSITRNYELEVDTNSLEDFLEELTLVSDISEHNDDKNKVTLMTIHAVKGLEYDYVFVVGMEEGIFPHFNAIYDTNYQAIEEERRLCYVAITRAKKELYLLNAKKRMLFGKEQRNMPSRFIEEIDSCYIEKSKTKDKVKLKDLVRKEMYNEVDQEYAVGEVIKHRDYGEGIIVSIDRDLITVAFSYPHGTMKMAKNHKSITKV